MRRDEDGERDAGHRSLYFFWRALLLCDSAGRLGYSEHGMGYTMKLEMYRKKKEAKVAGVRWWKMSTDSNQLSD